MALSFSGSGLEGSSHSYTALNNITQYSFLVWVYRTGSGAGGGSGIWGKHDTDANQGWKTLMLDEGTGDVSQPQWLHRFTSGTMSISWPTGTLALNTWVCLAGSLRKDNDGSNSIPTIYTGGLSTPLTATTPAYQNNYNGSTKDEAGHPFHVGNNGRFTAYQFPGYIAHMMLWNRIVPAGELALHQFRPHGSTGLLLWLPMGYSGTSTQVDLSGNAYNGTLTGATMQDNAPIQVLPRRKLWVPYAVAVAPVSINVSPNLSTCKIQGIKVL